MSLLVRSEILGLLVNPMTVDAKYSSHYAGNLLEPIQINLSLQLKTFCGYFIAFLQSI